MSATEGKRIYTIGDVHGCRDALSDMIARIRADLAADPHPDPLLIFLGDYTDRGPDSRGTIDDLITLAADPLPTRFLRGNHDDLFLSYITEPDAARWKDMHWTNSRLGGQRTLKSYGVSTGLLTSERARHDRFVAAVPDAHLAFLNATEMLIEIGAYIFVHAGLRPDVPLDQQTDLDRLWIRDPFLLHPYPFPGIVLHGHTPVPDVEHHGNRIAVDTGAVFGGRLSCVVLQDDGIWDLRDTGRAAMKPGYGIIEPPLGFSRS